MFAQWPWDKFESLSVWYVRGSFDGDGDRYWRGVWRASEREDGEKKGGLAVRIQIDDEHRGRLGEPKEIVVARIVHRSWRDWLVFLNGRWWRWEGHVLTRYIYKLF